MGYDMTWRTRPENENVAVNAARHVLDTALAVRNALPKSEAGNVNMDLIRAGAPLTDADSYVGMTSRYRDAHNAVNAAMDALDAAKRSYFRFNVFGMSRAVSIMYRVGMAFEDTPCPSWPRAEDFGTTNEHLEALENPEFYPDFTFTDEILRPAVTYRDALNAILAFHGDEIPGIPCHKFSSNDGWIVLPAECEAAAKIWDQWLAENGEDAAHSLIAAEFGGRAYSRWLTWVNWIREAARHDGFTVR